MKSSTDLIYRLLDPSETEMNIGTIIFGSIDFQLDFTPDSIGTWTLQLTFADIDAQDPSQDAQLNVDGRIIIDNLSSGIWIDGEDKSSFLTYTQYKLPLRYVRGSAKFWFLASKIGVYNILTWFCDPDDVVLDKISLNSYSSNSIQSIQYQTSSSQEITNQFQIETSDLGYWTIELHYRNKPGYCIQLTLTDPYYERTHLYLMTESGNPPLIDENFDNEADNTSSESIPTLDLTTPGYSFNILIIILGFSLLIKIKVLKKKETNK